MTWRASSSSSSARARLAAWLALCLASSARAKVQVVGAGAQTTSGAAHPQLEVKAFSFADELQEAFVVALKSSSKGAPPWRLPTYVVVSNSPRGLEHSCVVVLCVCGDVARIFNDGGVGKRGATVTAGHKPTRAIDGGAIPNPARRSPRDVRRPSVV